jgi:hypothetical protein
MWALQRRSQKTFHTDFLTGYGREDHEFPRHRKSFRPKSAKRQSCVRRSQVSMERLSSDTSLPAKGSFAPGTKASTRTPFRQVHNFGLPEIADTSVVPIGPIVASSLQPSLNRQTQTVDFRRVLFVSNVDGGWNMVQPPAGRASSLGISHKGATGELLRIGNPFWSLKP